MVADKQIVTSVEDVISFLLTKESMTPKKLQKMLYYCYSWALVILNENPEELEIELFNDKFEAWVHGPVIRKVYSSYKSFGYQEIPYNPIGNYSLPKEVEEILDQVWAVYGGYSGNQLESISHQEAPWLKARKGLAEYEGTDREIDVFDIYDFYSKVGA